MKKKLLYIVNPISGAHKKKSIEQIINQSTDKKLFDCEIVRTQYAGHAFELAQNAVQQNYDIVAAVGGDGTLNEIGKALSGSDTAMGIIPKGSGNGLARYLKIPLSVSKAVKIINSLHYFQIDTVRINEFFYLNVAGIGFDAHIAHLFSKSKKRGFQSYAKLVLKEFRKYEGQNYRLIIDEQKFNTENTFMLSFANSSQFGNNAHIAPMAKINDGFIDVCILKKFPDFRSPEIILKLYTRSLIKSKYYEIYKAKKIELSSDIDLLGHVDGEPVYFGKKLQIEILPKSLNVITGRHRVFY
ncbi:MAG: diacylglycerol kinase family lipid kinase [Bacteroidales bacterium]|nr:diacylglycerol kinase family lipid kinase [Bacteroidales bacterium]